MIRIVLSLSAFIFSGSSLAQTETRLTPDHVFDLEAASDPRISPDGAYIAYVRRSNDIQTDTTLGTVWLMNADGSDARVVETGEDGSASPRWSPDGDRLAFTTSDQGAQLIQVLHIRSGAVDTVARLDGSASGLRWSPDGTRLAFARLVPENGPQAAPLPERGEDMEWAAGAVVEDRLRFRLDGLGALPHGARQLYVVDVDDDDPVRITRDALGASADFVWGPDGHSLIFSADLRVDGETLAPDSELHRVSLTDGVISTLTNREGPDTSPRISPDGRHLAYLGYDDRRMGYHNTALYIAETDGSNARSLTANLDRSVANPVWSADGSGLYFQYADQGITRVAFVDLEGEITSIVDGLGAATFGRPYSGGQFTVSNDGLIAATIAPATHPAEIAVGNRETGLVRITDHNADVLDGVWLSEAEQVLWASPHDGRQIEGWALYPPDFDPTEEYPMILEIHGGPFSAYGPVFSAEFQLMAAAGYVVLYTNPRGSTSYGYEFANLIHHNYPGEDYDDLMGAVDTMLERGFIDPDRLFVTGGSGGGVLTAWIIGNTDRFAASVVAKPVINWASFVLYSDLPQFFYRYWFASAPWEDPEEYWRRSPLSLVGNVNTPTMVMVGGADVRTPRAESEQYYSALRLRGVPSRYVVIPDSFHGIANSRPSRLLTKVAEILRWFEMHDPALTSGQSEEASTR